MTRLMLTAAILMAGTLGLANTAGAHGYSYSNAHCRDFAEAYILGTYIRIGSGTACQERNGYWKVVDTNTRFKHKHKGQYVSFSPPGHSRGKAYWKKNNYNDDHNHNKNRRRH